MLRLSKPALAVLWIVAGSLIALLLVSPIVVIILTALAGSWNGVLPSDLTLSHVKDSLNADNVASLSVSLQTAIIATAIAVIIGTWAALSAQAAPLRIRRFIQGLFHLPAAVPSVVLGLGLLVAFSKGILVLNGTSFMVILAQSLLVLAFTFSTVSAASTQLDPLLAQQAQSLGASAWRVLTTITLPLLLPAIAAASGLSFALCMGELGATIMVYPPTWRTLPVTIFTYSDRGNIFIAAACTLVLVVFAALALFAIAALFRRKGSTARGSRQLRA